MKQHSKSNESLAAGGVLLVTLLTYASTFTFGWVYDDPPQIPQNQNLQWSRLGYLFTHHLWASVASPDARFYRPLLTVWFLINKTLFGLNPHWFHVTTVLAHVAATALAYAIARRLLKDSGAGLLVAAIFGLHPIQAESASWISSVNDSLAAVLCFASFLFYRKASGSNRTEGRDQTENLASHARVKSAPPTQRANVESAESQLRIGASAAAVPLKAPTEKGSSPLGVIWWIASALFFLLALLMKEVSIVLPAIILTDLLANSPSAQSRSSIRRTLATAISLYGLIGIAWLSFRAWVLGQATTAYSFVSWKTTILTAPKVFLFDLYRITVPRSLSPQYDLRLIESPTDAQFLASVAILAALSVLAVVAARRNPQLWIPFAWIIFPIVPTLNLRWLNQHDFIHDRYTYISMFGVAGLAGYFYSALKHRWPKTGLLRPIAGIVVLTLAFGSAIQAQYWANDVSLFARAVQIATQNEWAHLNYGAALSSSGRNAEAAPHFVRSYQLTPGWRAADFAAYAYQQSGDLSAAERWFNVAIEQNPALATAWFGLGQIRLAQHRPDEAAANVRMALQLQPDSDGYHYALGTALEQSAHPDQALQEYKIELRLHPYQAGARKAIERLERQME
jgi:hypothetical protein